MNKKTIAAACMVSMGLFLARADIYVDASADPATADGSPLNPFATIQAAVDAAPAGETIRIAEGVYDQGGDETSGSTSSRVKIDGKALHLIGAGRGKTVIEGNPGSGESRTGAWRCVYVNYAAGTVIEGVTLRNGATVAPDRSLYDSRSGGGILVAGGTGSDPLDVCLVDSEIAGCKAVYGGGARRGTLVRCLVDGCCAESGLAAHGSRLVNCVAVRSRRAGYVSEDGVAASSSIYNCTFVDNDARYAIVNGGESKGSVLVRSSTTATAYNSDASGCVAGLSAAHGDCQLIAPAFDDWRPVAGFEADGAADFSALENLSLPAGIDALKDFTGAGIVASGGRINAGAIQATATAAAGALLFTHGNVPAPVVMDGRTNSFANGVWVIPETYPAQYRVAAVADGGMAVSRLARLDASGNHISQLGFAPGLDGTLTLLPPPSVGETATNYFEFASAENVKWTDPENGDDGNPGTEAEPYKTLKAAMESIPASYATGGGHYVIYAKKGIYDEGTMTSTYATTVPFRLVVEAGAYGRIRIVAVDGPDETFIVGAPDAPGNAGSLDGCGPNAVRGVYISGRCDVALQGFTIAGCYSGSQYNSRMNGAAVYAYNNGDETLRAQVTDCVISNNFALKSVVCGGLLKRCIVAENTSKEAIFNGRDDGAATVNEKSPTAAFCVFAKNTLTEPGEGQGLIGGAARVVNCTVVGESGVGRVSGASAGSSLNTIYFGGEAVYGAATMSNCVFWGCADVSSVTEGNLVANPVFASVGEMDFRVDRNSPCAGYAAPLAANQSFWKVFDGAMDGELFFKNGRSVAGAYQKTAVVKAPGLVIIFK